MLGEWKTFCSSALLPVGYGAAQLLANSLELGGGLGYAPQIRPLHPIESCLLWNLLSQELSKPTALLSSSRLGYNSLKLGSWEPSHAGALGSR